MDVFRCITVCTHSEGWFPALQEGCRRFSIPLVVLGWGQPWKGFMWRTTLLQQYLSTLPYHCLVCIVDAYDMLPLLNGVHASF